MKKEALTVETDEEGTIIYCNASGKIHNANGPAIVLHDGEKYHYINSRLHNENGPAVVYSDGSKFYYINDQLHNPHGPAVIRAGGYKAHYINDKPLTETEFKTWQAEQTAK